MCNDMHDCSVGTGDTWLKNNLDAYAQWAKTHNSLLIVTFDEDNGGSLEPHPHHVRRRRTSRSARSPTQINHYNVLRTIESAYGLPHRQRGPPPITDVWN